MASIQPYSYHDSTLAANNMAATLGLNYSTAPCPPVASNMTAGIRPGPPANMVNPGHPYSAVKMDYYYPQLQIGVTEPVVVTEISDPHRLFCQLRSLSHEFHRISERMHHYYEVEKGYGDQAPTLVLGEPCASRGTDGRWYRALLQELFLEKQLAMVIHVDWGRRAIVPLNGLRNLVTEFFRMPVVTFPCTLYGVCNQGLVWNPILVAELRTSLLERHVNARIECYNSYEHLYGITLFAEDGTNLNCYLVMHSQSPKVCQNTLPATTELPPVPEDMNTVCTKQAPYMSKYPPMELKIGKFEDAVVEFVIDPSNFWVRLGKFAASHKEMVDGLTKLYSKASRLDGVIANVKPGRLCCASFQELYYRVEVVSTYDKRLVKVFFLDIGISEAMDWSNLRELPAEFTKLPALANKCCLADTYPVEHNWSEEAILAFKVAVTDKRLVIHVVSKDADEYAIEVMDQSRIEEKNVGKMLAKSGLARFEELVSINSHSTGGGMVCTESAKTLSPDASDYVPKIKETRASQISEEHTEPLSYSPFQDQLYDPGEMIEVVVSHVDNPGKFWCQNARSKTDLSTLMDAIQSHCKSTNCPYSSSTHACLAKSPQDGVWYRAYITKLPVNISKSSTVQVFYVDYGNHETVPLIDLRAINGEFFQLKAQAFKCSLYNLITPTGDNPFLWNSEATTVFREFVQKASKWTEFHCMFYATASQDKKPFNIVDLYTPFASLCDNLVERGYATPLHHKALAPSVQLNSYYYSMHDIKFGDEVQLHITHVESSSLFYAQLARNTALDMISSTIKRVLEKIPKMKLPPISGDLCLAKYSDQQWYRGCIQSENGSKKVFFVDFGNTERVLEKDLLPIMSSEHDLLLLPMQAIKCSLSDIQSKVSDEIVAWFENAVLEKTLKAVIVSRDADGKLSVELYNGKQQINATLKSKLGLRVLKDKSNLASDKPKTLNHDESKKLHDNGSNQERKTYFSVGKNVKSRESDTRSQSDMGQEPEPRYRKNLASQHKAETQDKSHSQEFSFQRKMESVPKKTETVQRTKETIPKKTEPAQRTVESVPKKMKPVQRKIETVQKVEPVQRVSSSCSYQGSLGGRDAKQDANKTLPQRQSSTFAAECQVPAKLPVVALSDIPKRKISPGMKEPVYVSHTNSIFDFYVQVAEDNRLDEMSEILNKVSSFEHLCDEDISVGNVICAYFPEDELYYRGVVTGKTTQGLCVEYIDYGNTKVISDSKNYRLPQKCHSIPIMSIHCSLSKAKNASTLANLEELLVQFSKRTCDIQLDCEFLKLDCQKWDVVLKDESGCINDLLAASEELVLEKSIKEVSEKVTKMKIVKEEETSSVTAFTWNLPQPGSTVNVYASAVDGPECFWCQLSAADIDSLASQVQEAGEQCIKSEDFIAALKIGSPCNVIFSEDNNWYRAIVTKMEADLVTVRFIDYGNEDCVGREQIQKLPEPLLKIPPHAFPCRLADFDMKAGTWSSEGKNYFYEKVTEDAVQLTVCEIQESSSCYIPMVLVTIDYNELNINEEMIMFWQELRSRDLALPDESTNLSPVELIKVDQPHGHKDSPTPDSRSSNLGESTPEGQFEECTCLGEDHPLEKDVIGDDVSPHHGEKQENDTDGVEETVDLPREGHADMAVEDADPSVLNDCDPQDTEDFGSYEENDDTADDTPPSTPVPGPGKQGVAIESGHPEIAACHPFPDLKSSRQQELLSRDTSESLESLILQFTEKLVLLNEEAISEDAAKEEVTTQAEITEEITIVAGANTAEELDDCAKDRTKQENEEVDVQGKDYMESKDPVATNDDVESKETHQNSDDMEEAAFNQVTVTSEDLKECGNTSESEALKANSFAASDDLNKAKEVVQSIMNHGSETIQTIEIDDEIAPSLFIEDAHKIENIVTNEDAEGTDTVEAIEVNEENKEAVASADATEEDIVDDKVPVEFLEIEPEKDVLKDETIKDDLEIYELVIYDDVTDEDDMALIFCDVDLLEIEDPLEGVAVTVDKEGPASQDCIDIEAIHTEDFIGNKETMSDEVTTEHLETITSKDFVPSKKALTISDGIECGGVTTTDFEEVIQEDKEVVSPEGAIEEARMSFEDLWATIGEDPLIDLYQDFKASTSEGPVAGDDMELKGSMNHEEIVVGEDRELKDSVGHEEAVTDVDKEWRDCKKHEEAVTDEDKEWRDCKKHEEAMTNEDKEVKNIMNCEDLELQESVNLAEVVAGEDKEFKANVSCEEIASKDMELKDSMDCEEVVAKDGKELEDSLDHKEVVAKEDPEPKDSMDHETVVAKQIKEPKDSKDSEHVVVKQDKQPKDSKDSEQVVVKEDKQPKDSINQEDVVIDGDKELGDSMNHIEVVAKDTEPKDSMDHEEVVCKENKEVKDRINHEEVIASEDMELKDIMKREDAVIDEDNELKDSMNCEALAKEETELKYTMFSEELVAAKDKQPKDSMKHKEVVAGEDMGFKYSLNSEETVDCIDMNLKESMHCAEAVTDIDKETKDHSKNKEIVPDEDEKLKDRMSREALACEDIETEEAGAFKVLCESLSTDFNDYDKPEIIQGFVETVKAESNQRVVEHLGTLTKDLVQSEEHLTSCDIVECGGVTTTYFEEVIQDDEVVASPEGAIEEASISFEDLEVTLVESPLIDLYLDFIARANEGSVAGEDIERKDGVNRKDAVNDEDMELKDRMNRVEVEGLETQTAAFEELFCESLYTDDINDHEEPETVQGFIETWQHDRDCERDFCDQTEDTFPSDIADTRQRETKRACMMISPAERALAEIVDVWERTAEDVTLQRDGKQPESFTVYRQCPMLIASTDSVYDSELNEPLEVTDSDCEDVDECGDITLREHMCQTNESDTEEADLGHPQGQAPGPRVSRSVEEVSPVTAAAEEGKE